MDSLNNSRAWAARLFTAAVNKHQAPNTELQRSFKFQAFMRARRVRIAPVLSHVWLLGFEGWCFSEGFSGAWSLGFGACYDIQ